MSSRYRFARAPAFSTACGLLLGVGVLLAQDAQNSGDQDDEQALSEEQNENGSAGSSNEVAKVAIRTLVRIENITVAPRDRETATVRFDIGWDGSWRQGNFFDAAWVFFKARADKNSEWQHLRLAADKVLNPTGYGQEKNGSSSEAASAKDGTLLEFVVPDGEDGFAGMFVRRAVAGGGTVETRGVTAVLDLSEGKAGHVEIRAFGIRMVYVPEGAFYLGKGNEEPAPFAGKGYGGMELNWFYRFGQKEAKVSFLNYTEDRIVHWNAGYTEDETPPYEVTSAGAIPTGRQKGKLWAVELTPGHTPEDNGEIPADFPNGYAAFYAMKYYIRSGQYADFLNTLTPAQARLRYMPGGHSVGIKRSGTSPNYTYSARDPERVCPWVSWVDGSAFAAWAGLRPMTELEFEKCVRGPRIPIPNDASLSYWGVADVLANAWYEREVSVGTAEGRAFKGTHGRGTPDLPKDWPTSLDSVTYRGGYFGMSGHVPNHLLVGGRTTSLFARSDRTTLAGWRGARSGPVGDTSVGPVHGQPDPDTVHLARLARPPQIDGVLNEWGEPTLTLASPSIIYPPHFRFLSMHCDKPWAGPEDLSARVWLGSDGEMLYVAAEVTDNVQCNTNTAENIWNGDCLQVGLVNSLGTLWNFGLALHTNGVESFKWQGDGALLSKVADRAVVRDEAAHVTRYELRVPLATVGLKPGEECCYYLLVFDDDGQGQQWRLQWLPTVMTPFKRNYYPKFVVAE